MYQGNKVQKCEKPRKIDHNKRERKGLNSHVILCYAKNVDFRTDIDFDRRKWKPDNSEGRKEIDITLDINWMINRYNIPHSLIMFLCLLILLILSSSFKQSIKKQIRYNFSGFERHQ